MRKNNDECERIEYQTLNDGQITTATTTTTSTDARNPLKNYKRLRNRKLNRTTTNQYSMHTNNNGNGDSNPIINYLDQIQVPAISCNYNGSVASSVALIKSQRDRMDDDSTDMMDNDIDDDMEDEDDGYPGDGDDDDDAPEQQQLEEHIFEPMSSENGQTTRPCLAWACKACKKKSVAVDRRKAATLRERRRLRKVCSIYYTSYSTPVQHWVLLKYL